ncbi:hypothetical protein [Sneathiella glossodoripedis]|uniref:hypothetical protein n=1 Tax=Sneathiella glossodoripedis TaxID=418853 RepID=UPI0004718222|nr:hypothetical protein [Sneathiella glossodoripedis]
MYKNLAIVSLFAVFSLNATAEEKFTFSLDTGVHHQWNQATTYAVDYLAPTKTSTDKSTLLIGGNAGISYALPSDSVFSNGIFGQNQCCHWILDISKAPQAHLTVLQVLTQTACWR